MPGSKGSVLLGSAHYAVLYCMFVPYRRGSTGEGALRSGQQREYITSHMAITVVTSHITLMAVTVVTSHITHMAVTVVTSHITQTVTSHITQMAVTSHITQMAVTSHIAQMAVTVVASHVRHHTSNVTQILASHITQMAVTVVIVIFVIGLRC